MMKPNAHWKTIFGDHFNKKIGECFFTIKFSKEYKKACIRINIILIQVQKFSLFIMIIFNQILSF